jgi:site-specific recombinase XerD
MFFLFSPSTRKFMKLMKRELSVTKPEKRHSLVINETKFLNQEKIKKLRKSVKKAKEAAIRKNKTVPVRDWFMIELGLFTGLRVEEMVNQRISDLYLEERPPFFVTKGKGNKTRTIYFPDAFKKICLFYLKWKAKTFPPSDYLFSKKNGRQLTKRSLQKSFKKCLRVAGLESHYSIHCLRHTYGSFLYKSSGHNLRLVQEQLGHSNVRTTQIYAGVMDDEVKNALEKLYRS